LKAIGIGLLVELVVVSPYLIWGAGHGGIPVNFIGWLPFLIHAPLMALLNWVGVHEANALVASLVIVTGLWSAIALMAIRCRLALHELRSGEVRRP
jgi:hypothetical protein